MNYFVAGPLSFNFENAPENITLTTNPNSWTKMANVIFVDMPAGAGFSYATTKEASISSDSIVVKQANDFLRKFLIDHPRFLKNPLYITGISYMGIVTPIITLEVPLTNKFMDFNSRVEYAHRMALISDDIYKVTYCKFLNNVGIIVIGNPGPVGTDRVVTAHNHSQTNHNNHNTS
ncbi:putative peptidase S10, serine carboxypeptidase, alpha/Beta hydrolase [Helianthus anomalus]